MKLFSTQEISVIARACRQIVYFFLLIGVMYGVRVTAKHFGSAAFSENGVIENTQLFFLSGAGFIFMLESLFIKSYRHILRVLVALCILGLFRECDALMDVILPVISWRIGFIFVVVTLIWGLFQWKDFKREVVHFLDTSSFHLMMAAMIVVIPISQCLGHRPLISSVVGDSCAESVRDIRRMIEESGELCGYFLILCAAIEFLLCSLKKNKKHS